MSIGWQCPKCHTIYSPFVQSCEKCTNKSFYQPGMIPKLTEEICQVREYYKRNPDQIGQPVYISCPCPQCSPRL